MSVHQIVVDPNGVISFVYSDELLSLAELGESTTQRASHVEPGPDGWYADMTPFAEITGVTEEYPVLGPFQFRRDALDEEVAWLKSRMVS